MKEQAAALAGGNSESAGSIAPSGVIFLRRRSDGRFEIIDPALSEQEWQRRAEQRRAILEALDRCEP